MAKCIKCGAHVDGNELYLVNGRELCEECSIVYQNPPQPCGGGNAHRFK